MEVDGVRVTSLRRTALDVARNGTFAQALAVIDGAMRLDVTRADLDELVDASSISTMGSRIARKAVEHGNRLAANVGESWSRAQMIEAGLPSPVLQREYFLEGHRHLPDFDWDGRLVGEFDGHIKYRGTLRPGEQPHEAVIREKEKDDRFRRAGMETIHWNWDMLDRDEMIPHLRRWFVIAGIVVAA